MARVLVSEGSAAMGRPPEDVLDSPYECPLGQIPDGYISSLGNLAMVAQGIPKPNFEQFAMMVDALTECLACQSTNGSCTYPSMRCAIAQMSSDELNVPGYF